MLRGKLLFFLIAGLVTVGILFGNVFGRLMDDHKLLGTELAGLIVLSLVVFGTIACIFIAMFAEILFHWLEKIADFKRRSGDARTAFKIYEICLKLDDMLLDNVFRRVIILGKISAAFGDLGKQRMARRVSKEAETLKIAEAQTNVDFRNAVHTANAQTAETAEVRAFEAERLMEPGRPLVEPGRPLVEPGQSPASWESMASDEDYDNPESDDESTDYVGHQHDPSEYVGPQSNDSRHGRPWRTRSFQTQPQLAQTNRRAPFEPQPLSQQLPPHVQPRQTPGFAPGAASEAVLRLSSVSVADAQTEPMQAAHRPVVYDSAMRKRLFPEPTPMESRAHHAEHKPAPSKYAGSWLYKYGFVSIFTMVASVYALDGSVRGAASVLLIGVILNGYWLHSNKL